MLLYSKIARMNKREIVVHNASLKGEVSTNTDLKKKIELLKLILKYKEQWETSKKSTSGGFVTFAVREF